MSKKCKAYSESKLGLEPPDNRKAFYAGWEASLAAEPTKPEPVAWMDRFGFVFRGKGPHETFTIPLYTAPPDAPTVKDSLTVQSRLDAESFREERDEARALLNGVLQDIEALRRDAERYWWLLNWLVKNGLLTWERCRIDTPESFGDWWILRKPKVIDGSSLLGYGKTENAAIDAAMGDKR